MHMHRPRARLGLTTCGTAQIFVTERKPATRRPCALRVRSRWRIDARVRASPIPKKTADVPCQPETLPRTHRGRTDATNRALGSARVLLLQGGRHRFAARHGFEKFFLIHSLSARSRNPAEPITVNQYVQWKKDCNIFLNSLSGMPGEVL